MAKSALSTARDLEHARQMAAEALDDFEGYDDGKTPARSAVQHI
jgi:hypothetical protein